MGLFDVLSPLLSWVDGKLALVAPAGVRVVGWALGCAALSMWLYARLSDQRRLARLHGVVSRARRALARYDGSFSGVRHRIGRLLALSVTQVVATLKPAVVASIPLLLVLTWLGGRFNLESPAPGETIAVTVQPQRAPVVWQPPQQARPTEEGWLVSWPSTSSPLHLLDAGGRRVLTLPLEHGSTVVHKRRWYNVLVGNPAGYLDEASRVERIDIALPSRTFLPMGPDWLRTSEATFLLVLTACSLALKLLFRLR